MPTPLGDARVVADLAGRPTATLALGHGASGGIDAPDLTALAAGLPARGISVLRVEQPWRVQGGRVAPAPARLDVGWVAALQAVRAAEPAWVSGRLVVGGRSAGARVACRTAAALHAAGVVALAFPLHPPGRPDRTRSSELTDASVPVLVAQGTRDPFGGPDLLPPGIDVHVVVGGDHSLVVPKRGVLDQDEALELMVEAVVRWVRLLGRE